MIFKPTIFEYIISEEFAYKTKEIQVGDNWYWNMNTHLLLSFHMKFGKYINLSNDPKTKPPFHNIILPILEFRYAAEDRDVKDIVFETEDPEKQHLSFLIKKYWDDVFTIENNIDGFLDDAIEEKVDFGGVLVKKGVWAVPEVIPLQSIAFCDQTDILGGPIGFKFNYSPEALKLKAKLGWGDKKYGADTTIDELINLATAEKNTANKRNIGHPGTNIEVFIVRGSLPADYLDKKNNHEDLINQVQIVAFYQDEDGKKGRTLYKAKETESVLKVHIPKKIYQRGLGLGGVEVLLDTQVWANFAEIHKNNLLKAASKVGLYTDDDNFTNRNKVQSMENLEVLTIDKESRYGIRQIPTISPNLQLFDQRVAELEAHAQKLAGATDPLLGRSPAAGTPFRLQQQVIFEGKKPHERTASKFDKFLEEIINDWVIPYIVGEITKGKKFLATLTSDEMQYILQKVPTNRANVRRNEEVLNGQIPGDLKVYEEQEKQALLKNGNRHILEILKDEFKGVNMSVKIRISNTQKDMALFVDKLVNILRQFWTLPPELKNDPTTQHLMNQLLEASGLSPASLGGLTTGISAATTPAPALQEAATNPLQEFSKTKALVA